MSRITGNKKNIGAKGNLGIPMKLTIVLNFPSVFLSKSSPPLVFSPLTLSQSPFSFSHSSSFSCLPFSYLFPSPVSLLLFSRVFFLML